MKNQIVTVLKSTLALTLAFTPLAAANAQLLKAPIHMHPNTDTRVSVHVRNESLTFCEVTVDGKTYQVNGRSAIVIKAPVGTVVYAGFGVLQHAKGTVLVQLDKQLDGKTISIS